MTGFFIAWSIFTLMSFGFVVYDLIKNTPEAGVMKFGWALVVLYTGPIGLFFYFMACREPMPGTHEKFTAPLWKQATGSEVHCLAGDVTGILLMSLILSAYHIPRTFELFFEYLAGFFFGLVIFQALFMKKMHGGSYLEAIKKSFIPEFLSMNYIMAGMIPVMAIWGSHNPMAKDPSSITFWGMMSFATIVGGFVAYPINKWLVKKGMKHGMMTVRKGQVHMEHSEMTATQPQIKKALIWSGVVLVIGIIIAVIFS